MVVKAIDDLTESLKKDENLEENEDQKNPGESVPRDKFDEEEEEKSEYEVDKKVRVRMENLIFKVFKHNQTLSEFGLLNKFVHLISIDRLQLALADEFIELDVLESFNTVSIFRRTTCWQIFTMLAAFLMIWSDTYFGNHAKHTNKFLS